MLEDFKTLGLTKVFDLNLGNTLKSLQKLIYTNTKKHIIDHDENLDIEEKIKLPFVFIPTKNDWSNIMNIINSSNELKEVIEHKSVIDKFREIFTNPKKYEISTFRARYPSEERVIYNWHQDEGTWYLSKNKNHLNKFTATMWLSINGANSQNSIQLLKNSHKKKLFDHKYVMGQGYFNAELKEEVEENNQDLVTINTKPSQAVIFHPLTLHRSVSQENKNGLYPRYSVDIRYYDFGKKLVYNSSLKFKLKKILNIFKWT